jgi:hypothetical protein
VAIEVEQAMEKVVSLESIRSRKAAGRGFREWRRRLPALPELTDQTRWSDFPDRAIVFLAEDSPESRLMIHDLLMGALGLGSGYDFESLEPGKLLPLLDLNFILLDQMRFECMRRLGWIAELPWEGKSIIDLIRTYQEGDPPLAISLPSPTSDHPAFEDYQGANEMERRILFRRSIPEAVRLLRIKVNERQDNP